ncbi:hypothetical protein SmJEL517_g05839 [Synchytrium microbalum]|uniref:Nucleoporin Nup54 alpha-helical domain-containing protein n=1 Tax=Synchytrium microbalum TaxID=1806994 RepID=A0A507BTQ7_9FUNG|nr:uncharacterized protein SmJEL517_g05839 [Synchytrium microbalum]TPX30641.1 hypothetical protein SmJEL517_g05839 [Synchytrium microbalum]
MSSFGGFGGFGGQQQQQQPQQNMFGQPQQQQQPQQQGGFGGFGQPQQQQQQPAFGSFGQQQQTPNPFGQQPQPISTSFGAPQQQQPATNAFGAFGQQPQQQQTSLFAQPQQQQQPAFGGFGGFGQPQQQQQQQQQIGAFGSSMFGTQNAFGAAGQSMFGAPQQQQVQQQQQQEDWKSPRDVETAQRIVRSLYPKDVMDQLYLMREMWNQNSKFYVFRHYLLNFVQPTEVKLYQPGEGDYLFGWMEKKRAIPDEIADKAVPVQILGFEGLDKRCKQQRDNNAIHNLESRVAKIRNHHFLDTTMRLTAYQRKNAELSSRIARLMSYTQVLRTRSTSIKPDEEAFKARIEALSHKLDHESQIRARIMELSTRIEHLRDDRTMTDVNNTQGGGGTAGLEGAIAGDVDQLKDVLQDHEKWLASLTEIVKKDAGDVGKMLASYAEVLAPHTS